MIHDQDRARIRFTRVARFRRETSPRSQSGERCVLASVGNWQVSQPRNAPSPPFVTLLSQKKTPVNKRFCEKKNMD